MGLLIARTPPRTIVVVPRSRLLDAAKALAECGCFHPSGRGDERLRNLARRLRGEVEVLAQRIRGLIEKLGVEPEKRVVELEVSRNVAASTSSLVSSINRFLEEVETGLGALAEGRVGPLAEYVSIIERYGFIDVDLDALRESRYLKAMLYRVPADSTAAFEERLRATGAYLVGFSIEPGYTTYVVVYTPSIEQTVTREAAEAGALPILLPRRRLSMREVEEAAAKLYEALRKLEALSALLKIIESAYLTRTFAVFTGYVSEESMPKLLKSLDKSLRGAYTVYARPIRAREPEELPVEYEPPKLLKPFADLLTMYGLPTPGEFIPLLMMAITFPIIFGLMFPDAGHGLVLLLFGLYLLYKSKSEGWRSIGQLLVYVSIPAIIFGIMAAEFFGPVTPVADWLDKSLWHGHPPYASPVHELYKMLIGEAHGAEAAEAVKVLTFRSLYVSLALGSVLLTIASWLGVWRASKERDPEHLLHTLAVALAFTGVLVIFAGSYAVGLNYAEGLRGTLPVAYAMFGSKGLPPAAYTYGKIAEALLLLGIILDLAAPLIYGHESIGQRIILSFVGAFDLVLVVLSNTLSFVRIMGLMLAHSGLMYGFYVIAAQAAGIKPPITDPMAVLKNPVGLSVYVIGNLFVMGFEAFVANIHTLRLHFYEMFTKFYEGRGHRYQPVKLPANVVIKVVERAA